MVNLRTHQRDEDRGWGDEKVRGRRKGDMQEPEREEDGMRREKQKRETKIASTDM